MNIKFYLYLSEKDESDSENEYIKFAQVGNTSLEIENNDRFLWNFEQIDKTWRKLWQMNNG